MKSIRFLLIALFVPLFFAETAMPFSNRIIEFFVFEKQLTDEMVQLECSGRADFKSFFLHDPDRIVVDMPDCVFPYVHKARKVHGGIVTRIRVSQHNSRTVRVVLDLKEVRPYHVEFAPDKSDSSQLLRIYVSLPRPTEESLKKDAAALPPPPAPEHASIQTPQPSVPKPEPVSKTEVDSGVVVFSQADITEDRALPDSDLAKVPSFDWRGSVFLKGAWDTGDDSATENERAFRNRIRLEGRWYPLSRTRSRNLFLLASLDSDYLWFGPENKARDYDLDLYEGYMSWSPGPLYLTLGKQIVRWGKTDQISPVDNLNPQDLRQLIVPDYEDRKIPVLMARMGLHSDTIGVEGVYIPFFEPARIDYFGTDWAVFRHIKADAQRSSLDPATKTYIDTRFVDEDRPSNAFKNGEWGIRLSRTIGNVDLALSYLYAWEDMPFFSSFPIKNFQVAESASFSNMLGALADANPMDEPLEVVYKRSGIGGLEFETTAGPLGLRGEAAYFDNQSFLTNTFTSLRSPVFHYVLGADYSGPNDLYINAQLSHQVILDYDSSILYFKRHNVSLLGELKKGIWENYLEASLKYSLALSEHSYYLCPSIIFKYINNLDVAFGYNLFQGDSDTLFGYYDDNDQVYLSMKYHF